MFASPRLRFWLGIAVLVAALAAIYHPVVDYPYVWTDHAEIEEQTLVPRSLSEMGEMFIQAKGSAKTPAREAHLQQQQLRRYAYYRPIKALTYGLDWAVGQGRPWSFHLSNLVLHLAVSILLLLVCRGLFGDRYPFLPECIALLHAVMPLHVEAVSWVSARSDVLWGLFTLGGILLLQRARQSQASWKLWLYPGLAGLATLLAAGSKESGLFTAAVLVTYSALVPDRHNPGWFRRVFREGWAPAAGVIGYLALRLLVIGDINVGSLGARTTPGLWTLLDLFGRNLQQSLVPLGLTLADTLPVSSGPTLPGLLGLGLMTAWLAFGLYLRRSHPLILFCAAGFLLTVLPISQLFPLLHPRGERYLYLPAMFSQTVLLYACWLLAERLGASALRWLMVGSGVCALVGLALLSHVRTQFWADERLLFTQAVAEQPNCAECWNNLAFAEAVRGRYRQAEMACLEALSIDRRRYLGARDGFSLRFILIRSLLLQGRGHQAVPWIWQLIRKGGPAPANLRLLVDALVQAAVNRKLSPDLLFVGN